MGQIIVPIVDEDGQQSLQTIDVHRPLHGSGGILILPHKGTTPPFSRVSPLKHSGAKSMIDVTHLVVALAKSSGAAYDLFEDMRSMLNNKNNLICFNKSQSCCKDKTDRYSRNLINIIIKHDLIKKIDSANFKEYTEIPKQVGVIPYLLNPHFFYVNTVKDKDAHIKAVELWDKL